jgi:hypothetical protein
MSELTATTSPVRRALIGLALVASVGAAGLGVTAAEHSAGNSGGHSSVGALRSQMCWYKGWFLQDGVWWYGWFSEPC